MTDFEIRAVKFRSKLNRVFPSSKTKFFCSAIICAGGSGTRMGGVAKQLLSLRGLPCILYSLLAFQACDEISELIVVGRKEERDIIESLCHMHKITKLKAVVLGGDTRQASVMNGFLQISPKSEIVAIHDAARPLITPEQISRLIQTAKRYGASCFAKKMTDTVKRADEKGMITDTIPRESLYTVQTPQVFKTDIYRVSTALAQKSGAVVTDDCALVEMAGFPIKLVEFSEPNLKLTTPEDVGIISGILKERENG